MCGLLTDTTFAVDVTTKAKASDSTNVANYGEELWDTAKLIGYVPEGGSIEFQVHHTKKGEVPVCTDANLLATLRPIDAAPLEGGFYDQEHPLEVVSERWKNQVDYDSDVYFVEVTKYTLGRIISQGQCGDTEDTVSANAAVAAVARTDGSIVPLVAGGAGAMILIGLRVILVAHRGKARDHAE